jgi:FkbM family methyltransferase
VINELRYQLFSVLLGIKGAVLSIPNVVKMLVKGPARKLAERLTGTKILRYGELPYGFDLFIDLSRRLDKHVFSIVFDVGANIGQSALEYNKHFPSASIYCFEPITEAFNLLNRNTEAYPRIHCFQLAFGSTNESGIMLSDGTSTMNYLLSDAEIPGHDELDTEYVEVLKLDNFCKKNSINHVSYLKVDTEGGDLDVLVGAHNMLLEQKIDLVEVEAGMNPDNTHHVQFEALKGLLEKYNYFLFGLYEQVEEWPTGEPQLRRTNAVFISKQLRERSKKSKSDKT